ncbi:hypothetical protein NIES4075_69790 [Tolypothrix sp. NIES-4075]|uniref:hypothetical protein n=1 Tax=Tolypothrix sp. NIES-4075 TaxID=2005459 RepID=UPI000B5CE4D5|nr:hypothetical protein [Tolypothrix sp. NIES-4075]GAX45958.1 hypothetical protein NIES4075_69790 [Tolypothrix sp. NIES-4075]
MTTSGEEPSDRLDRIEAILLQTATQQQTNTFVLGEVATKLDQLTNRVEQVAAEVANLNDILMASIEIAETDRQTFQAEIRRVWEYLVREGENGNSPLA